MSQPPGTADVPPAASDPYEMHQSDPPAFWPPNGESVWPPHAEPSYTSTPPAIGQQPHVPGVAGSSFRPPSDAPGVPYVLDSRYQAAAYPPGTTYPGHLGNVRRPQRRGAMMTKVLPIVLAVAALGGVGGWLATRSSGSSAPAANRSAAGNATAPVVDATQPAGGSSTVFVLPTYTAGDLELQANSGIGDQFAKAATARVPGKTTAGVYANPKDPRATLFLIGVETKAGASKAAVERAFAGPFRDSSVAFARPTAYSPGAMGGVMECAAGIISQQGSDLSVSMCVVGDHHGLIIAVFTERSVSSAAGVTRTLRPTFESQ